MRSKFKWIFTLLVALSMQFSFAQDRTVTGVVSDNSGSLPGVNVVVQGTKTGTQTDIDGKFAIKAKTGDVLVFSYVGMPNSTVKVGVSSSYKVKMTSGQELKEVVITGQFGIKKKVDAITSSQQTVSSKELNQAVNPSIVQSLAGKVSGLQINNTATGVNGTNTIRLRGFRTLTGNADALVVIDGSISTATILGQLPPDVVESLTVLKGQQGASLYGEQGSNGVIIVNTKKGSKNSKPVISVHSSVDFEDIAYLPERQTKYGQGWFIDHTFGTPTVPAGPTVTNVPIENGSWGAAYTDPRYAGTNQPTGLPQANGQFLLLPYTPNKNNIKPFFKTGNTYQNGFTINLGDENGYVLLSVNRVNTDFIVQGDKLVKNSFLFKGGKKLGNWSFDGTVNYAATNTTETDAGLYQDLLQAATNIPVELYSEGNNFHHWTAYYRSPYWKEKNIRFNNNANNINLGGTLGYKINNNISVSYTASGVLSNTINDYHNNGFLEDYTYDFAPYTYGGTTAQTFLGLSGASGNFASSYYKSNILRRNFNGDLLLNFDYKLTENIGYKANLGTSMQDNTYNIETIGGSNLNKPNLYNINNITLPGNVDFSGGDASTPTQFIDLSTRKLDNKYIASRKVGAFLNNEFAYKDYLFLNATARIEKGSTINSSQFYPSVGLSYIPTKGIEALKDNKILNFLKVYANYSVTGNASAVGAYETSGFVGNLGTGYSFGALTSYVYPRTQTDQNIKPEFVTTKEFGGQLGFFKDRITLSGSVYQSDTKDLITNSTTSFSSGISALKKNIGNLENKGMEFDLGLVPVSTNNFKWEIRASYSAYRTKVTKLADGVDELLLNSSGTNGAAGIYAVVGEDFPTIKGVGYQRDNSGNIIVGTNGNPLLTTTLKNLGKVTPDYTLGLTNTFDYKGLRFTAVMDYRTGNKFYSGTLENLTYTGQNVVTADFDRTVGYLIPGSVQIVGGVSVPNTTLVGSVYSGGVVTANGGPETAGRYFADGNYRTNAENFVLDGTAFKVRELALSYSIPTKLIERTGLTSFRIGINARNIYTAFGNPFKNKSTYENKGYGDAENNNTADAGVNANGSGITSIGQYPATKTYGFSINLTF